MTDQATPKVEPKKEVPEVPVVEDTGFGALHQFTKEGHQLVPIRKFHANPKADLKMYKTKLQGVMKKEKHQLDPKIVLAQYKRNLRRYFMDKAEQIRGRVCGNREFPRARTTMQRLKLTKEQIELHNRILQRKQQGVRGQAKKANA